MGKPSRSSLDRNADSERSGDDARLTPHHNRWNPTRDGRYASCASEAGAQFGLHAVGDAVHLIFEGLELCQ